MPPPAPGYNRNAREFSRVGNAGVKFRDGPDDIEVMPARTGDAIILRVNGSFSKSVTILRYRSGGGVQDGVLLDPDDWSCCIPAHREGKILPKLRDICHDCVVPLLEQPATNSCQKPKRDNDDFYTASRLVRLRWPDALQIGDDELILRFSDEDAGIANLGDAMDLERARTAGEALQAIAPVRSALQWVGSGILVVELGTFSGCAASSTLWPTLETAAEAPEAAFDGSILAIVLPPRDLPRPLWYIALLTLARVIERSPHAPILVCGHWSEAKDAVLSEACARGKIVYADRPVKDHMANFLEECGSMIKCRAYIHHLVGAGYFEGDIKDALRTCKQILTRPSESILTDFVLEQHTVRRAPPRALVAFGNALDVDALRQITESGIAAGTVISNAQELAQLRMHSKDAAVPIETIGLFDLVTADPRKIKEITDLGEGFDICVMILPAVASTSRSDWEHALSCVCAAEELGPRIWVQHGIPGSGGGRDGPKLINLLRALFNSPYPSSLVAQHLGPFAGMKDCVLLAPILNNFLGHDPTQQAHINFQTSFAAPSPRRRESGAGGLLTTFAFGGEDHAEQAFRLLYHGPAPLGGDLPFPAAASCRCFTAPRASIHMESQGTAARYPATTVCLGVPNDTIRSLLQRLCGDFGGRHKGFEPDMSDEVREIWEGVEAYAPRISMHSDSEDEREESPDREPTAQSEQPVVATEPTPQLPVLPTHLQSPTKQARDPPVGTEENQNPNPNSSELPPPVHEDVAAQQAEQQGTAAVAEVQGLQERVEERQQVQQLSSEDRVDAVGPVLDQHKDEKNDEQEEFYSSDEDQRGGDDDDAPSEPIRLPERRSGGPEQEANFTPIKASREQAISDVGPVDENSLGLAVVTQPTLEETSDIEAYEQLVGRNLDHDIENVHSSTPPERAETPESLEADMPESARLINSPEGVAALAEQNPTAEPDDRDYDSMPNLEALTQPIPIASAEQTQVSFEFETVGELTAPSELHPENQIPFNDPEPTDDPEGSPPPTPRDVDGDPEVQVEQRAPEQAGLDHRESMHSEDGSPVESSHRRELI